VARGEPFEERGREPRFADAGLAGEQHHLALVLQAKALKGCCAPLPVRVVAIGMLAKPTA
jgi:hypothetical protein